MKVSTIRCFTAIAALLLVSLNINAQKYGYLNSALLLSEHPDIKSADSQLETYQTQLIASGETMVTAFQQKLAKYQKEASEGLLSQVQMQQKEGELAQEQTKIQQYELDVQNKMLAKREALYQPILDKVKVALEAIGKENGYSMIFDASNGTILHADESDDVMPLVKAKLGM